MDHQRHCAIVMNYNKPRALRIAGNIPCTCQVDWGKLAMKAKNELIDTLMAQLATEKQVNKVLVEGLESFINDSLGLCVECNHNKVKPTAKEILEDAQALRDKK